MSNMSYVRFENTYRDLKDCAENMDEPENLSLDEQKYRKRMIELCCEIAAAYGEREGEDD